MNIKSVSVVIDFFLILVKIVFRNNMLYWDSKTGNNNDNPQILLEMAQTLLATSRSILCRSSKELTKNSVSVRG